MNSNHFSSPYNLDNIPITEDAFYEAHPLANFNVIGETSDWNCDFPLYTGENYVQAPEADASLDSWTGVQSSMESLRHEQPLPSDNLVISPTIVHASGNDAGAIYPSHLNTDQEAPNPSSMTSEYLLWFRHLCAPVIPEAVEPKVDMDNVVVMGPDVYDIEYTGYERDPDDVLLKPMFMMSKPKGKRGVLPVKKERKKATRKSNKEQTWQKSTIDPNIETTECFTAGINLCGKNMPFQVGDPYRTEY